MVEVCVDAEDSLGDAGSVPARSAGNCRERAFQRGRPTRLLIRTLREAISVAILGVDGHSPVRAWIFKLVLTSFNCVFW